MLWKVQNKLHTIQVVRASMKVIVLAQASLTSVQYYASNA